MWFPSCGTCRWFTFRHLSTLQGETLYLHVTKLLTNIPHGGFVAILYPNAFKADTGGGGGVYTMPNFRRGNHVDTLVVQGGLGVDSGLQRCGWR